MTVPVHGNDIGRVVNQPGMRSLDPPDAHGRSWRSQWGLPAWSGAQQGPFPNKSIYRGTCGSPHHTATVRRRDVRPRQNLPVQNRGSAWSASGLAGNAIPTNDGSPSEGADSHARWMPRPCGFAALPVFDGCRFDTSWRLTVDRAGESAPTASDWPVQTASRRRWARGRICTLSSATRRPPRRTSELPIRTSDAVVRRHGRR